MNAMECDSAGTANYHLGEPPDQRAILAGANRGYDLSQLRGRQIDNDDFAKFDLILAMDKTNLKNIKAIAPDSRKAQIELLGFNTAAWSGRELVDPYWSEADAFEQMFVDLELLVASSIDYCQTHLMRE